MTARITVAQLVARIDAQDTRMDALVGAQIATTDLLSKLAASTDALSQAVVSYTTPATVTAITEAKTAKARTSTPAKATADTATKTVTLKTAQKRVDEGADAWKVFVKSSATGEPIPYGLVLRANKAQARKAGKATATTPATTPASTKAVERPFFAMGGKELATLAGAGNATAQAEIDLRAAKRAKVAAK